MEIEFDASKNARNIKERDLSFDRAKELDWDTAQIQLDDRTNYGEDRFIAVGYLDARLHVLVFLETETGIRVISFRKANVRERRLYDEAQDLD